MVVVLLKYHLPCQINYLNFHILVASLRNLKITWSSRVIQVNTWDLGTVPG